jgi:hypothetical protein
MRLTGMLVLLSAPLAVSFGADEGFVPLVQGDDPKQFDLIAIGADTIAIKDGVVALTGKPNGYFATKKSYKNYILRFEWMYERPEGLTSDAGFDGNSGVLLHIDGHKVWPKSVEVQLANSDAGNIFPVGPAKFSGKKDAAAQKKAIKPVGQWNSEEVVCKDGAITCTINGTQVATGTGASPDHGPIGFQSEGRPIRFRNLTIKPLD